MDTRARDYTLRLLAEARAQHDRADAKALGLLGVASTVGAVVGGAMLVGDWSPSALPVAAQVLWWVGAATGMSGVVLLAAVVVPGRPATGDGDGVGYFGHVPAVATRGPAALAYALCVSAAAEVGVLAGRLNTCAQIATRKYRLIRAGVGFLAVAGACVAAATLTGGAR